VRLDLTKHNRDMFGHASAFYKHVKSTGQIAPYALANAFMSKSCQDVSSAMWRQCPACASSKTKSNIRLQYLTMMKLDYARMLLKEPPLQLQLLSLLDARMNVLKH
jgi:hypothetical protein